MAAVFLHGPLRHPPLRERVLGRSDLREVPASLSDHEVRWAAGPHHALLLKAPGQVEGVLCEGVSPGELARIDFYQGGHDLVPRLVEVQAEGRTCKAWSYFPRERPAEPHSPWSLEDWAATWAPLALCCADEVMVHFGSLNIEALQRWLPRMRSRTWARLLAQEGRPTVPDTPSVRDVTVRQIRRRHSGFFALDEYRLSYPRFDGGRTEELLREVFHGSDAALLLPYDAASDRLVLIEQFRMGPMARQDPAPWLFEPIAGLIEPGERPETTARREAEEEAGLRIGQMELIGRTYASPGNATEFFHCYLGHCRLGAADRWAGGLAEEDEDIRAHLMSFDRAMHLLDSGAINVAPLALMLLWLARHRDRLRASA